MAPQPPATNLPPPPELPSMPDVSHTMSNYLRTFSLWCRNGFGTKMPLHQALPGILLAAYDPMTNQPNGITYYVTVKDGAPPTLIFTTVAAGSGQP